jgi:hydrogenase-4 membrane subunit HyfE
MADLLFVSLLLVDLYMIGASRLAACIRASALQGLLLAVLPFFFTGARRTSHSSCSR